MLKHLAVFRVALALYLACYFAGLLPYAREIYSNAGMLPAASLNFTYGFFPNVLSHWDSPLAVQVWLSLLTLCAVAFGLGRWQRLMAFVLWYGAATLLHRNNFTEDPAVHFLGFILLVFTVVPAGEELPRGLFQASWLVFAVAYSISGFDKLLHSPSWRSGDAVRLIVDSAYGYPSPLRTAFLALPAGVLRVVTWTAALAEASFALLALTGRGRAVAWVVMTGVHAGMLLLTWHPDLTIGMLLAHWFAFDPRWAGAIRSALYRAGRPGAARLSSAAPG